MKKNIQFIYTGLVLLAALAGAPWQVQAQDPWPMFRQNIFHTGYTNFTGPLAPDVAWQYNTAGYTYSSPVVTNTRVYIASESELTALNLDGDEIWVFPFAEPVSPPTVELRGLISTPAVAPDGTVYIGSLDHNLYAINSNGTLKWTLDLGDELFSSPAIGADGTVYIGAQSGQLSAVNPNGTIRWIAFTQGEILASPAISPEGNVFIGATDNRLYSFNSTNGGLIWTFEAQGEIVSSPALGNGNVYFGSIDNRVYAVNAATGSAAWSTPFQTGAEIVSSPAVGPDGTVYIGSFDHRFYAINGFTGVAKWQNPLVTGELIAASPAIDGFNNIYITSLDGSLYVLSDATSRFNLLWSFPTGSPIWASPAIGPNSNVFIAATGSQSEAGRLFAINQASFTLTFSSQLIEGQDAPFSVTITGAPLAASATLFYRPAGALDYATLPFSGNAVIPGTAITGAGLEYYIDDLQGNTFPDVTPSTKPAARAVFISGDTSPDFLSPRIHRMISVPYDLNGKTIQDVLVDDYPAYGAQSWRLHRWRGNRFVEYPDLTDDFEPGNAFFLVTTQGDPFNVGPGFSVDTSRPYPIALQPGWNQIGNPFGYPVSWNRVIRNPEVVNTIAFFDGAEMIQDPDEVSVLRPWEGYFVYNASDQEVTILIAPEPAPVETEVIEEAAKSSVKTARIRITASVAARNMEDSQNWVGFAEDAPLGLQDVEEAPPFGENIRLSIVENDKRYAINVKPFNAAGASWDLKVSASDQETSFKNTTVLLNFTAEGTFDESIKWVLVDKDYGYAQLVDQHEIAVDWGDALTERNFNLVAGTDQYIDTILNGTPIAPDKSALNQNFPNPFQTHTNIRYQLQNRSAVTLTIYNLLGQEVQKLVQATQNPGQYEVVWDGLDAAALPVSSGIYIYRLQAGAFSSAGKMALVR